MRKPLRDSLLKVVGLTEGKCGRASSCAIEGKLVFPKITFIYHIKLRM